MGSTPFSFQPGEGPSRGLLRDCTTGCGTDGALHSTSTEGQGAAHDGGGGQSHAGLLRGQVDGLLVVVGGHGDVALPHRVGRGLVIVQPPLGPVLLLGTRSASLVYH